MSARTKAPQAFVSSGSKPLSLRRQPTSTKKVSVSIERSSLEWLVATAKRDGTNLSMKMTEAINNLRRDEARDRVLEYLGDAATLTDADRARIDAEWA